MIAFAIAVLFLFGCCALKNSCPGPGTVARPSAQDWEEGLEAVVDSFMSQAWHDHYREGGDRSGDIVIVRIAAPRKYAGFKLKIMDEDRTFVRKSLSRPGQRVRLVLHQGVWPLVDGNEIYVSAFREIAHSNAR